MAAPLATCTKEEQRSVIRFLSSEWLKPIEIHRRMKVQYGDAYLSLQQVYKWSRKFMNCTSSVTDSPRPGQAHRVVTPEDVAAVEPIVKENRHVTVNEMAAHGGYIKKCSHCVPLCSVNYEMKSLLGFHLTHPRRLIRKLRNLMLVLFYLYPKISGIITVSAAMLNLCITLCLSDRASS